MNWIENHQESFVVIKNEEWTYIVNEKKTHIGIMKKRKGKYVRDGTAIFFSDSRHRIAGSVFLPLLNLPYVS